MGAGAAPQAGGDMRVLLAAAEMAPVARVGGLAEAVSGLVRALRDQGVEVEVVLPDYGDVRLQRQFETELESPWWTGPTRIRSGSHSSAGELTLVGVTGMARPHPYVDEHGEGWPDNDHRFMAFSAAVATLTRRSKPDVLHLNDWHSAAALGMLAAPPPTVLTIHTLGYQGHAPRAWLEHLPVGTHHFSWHEGCNPLAGGIALTDRVIAVSPNYAREIVTPEGGMGLDGRLKAIGDRLVGIRNGIDTATWSPAVDPLIAAPFDATDLSGREACRDRLIELAGWSARKPAIVAAVTRLVDQKGIDLLVEAAHYLEAMPARLAVLGAGDASLAASLHELASERPESVFFAEGYDEALGHALFAGSDLFVMPSRFEPCGLAQMQAMSYGSLPVVTDVGGLHDTVVDADARRDGTGFVTDVSAAGIVDGLHRGVRSLRNANRRRAIQSRGMSIDWSWDAPAAQHIGLYQELLSARA
ncbi:MAG: glycogen/starch synthase [Acidimicrobiaceae bacterium]|nr:glycogen/starch synthase [Acidimicrobiaceae bacterium]